MDVITGLIKANFPARIAFAVTSQIDSRVILDAQGAEQLLGRGDMLFMSPEGGKLERLQGTYLSDDEINKVVSYWKSMRTLNTPVTPTAWEQGSLLPAADAPEEKGAHASAKPAPAGLFDDDGAAPFTTWTNPQPGAGARNVPPATNLEAPLFEQIDAMKAVDNRDVLFDDAVRVVREADKGSVSLLQKKLRVGYGRASRLVEQMVAAGILGAETGASGVHPVVGSGAARPTPARPQWASGDKPVAPSLSAPPAPQMPVPKPRIIGDADDYDDHADSNAADAPGTRTPPDTPGAPQSAPGVWM